ncbi:MAG: gliding motility-associated C-terminal domain-containing protein [Flavobacteriales bacterium]|nr:gliding motility-associated C-terminal domain-containing protein [Flavobacteriales bacterium]
MLRLPLSLFWVLCITSIWAQETDNWTSHFNSSYFTKAHSIDFGHDEIIAACDVYLGPFGEKDISITRFNDSGEIISSFVIGTDDEESGRNIIVRRLMNSDILISGYWIDYPSPNRRAFVARFTEDGELIWSMTPEESEQHDSPRDIFEQEDGSIIWCGSTISNSFGETDGFVVKLSAEGEQLWSMHIGGNNDDHFYAIEVHNDLIYLAGNSESLNGIHHGFIVTLNQEGEMTNQIAVVNTHLELFFTCDMDEVGNLFLAGYTRSTLPNARDIWICKLDTEGALEWNFAFTGGFDDSCTDLIITNDKVNLICNAKSFQGGDESVLITQLDKDSGEILDSFLYSLEEENTIEEVTGAACIANDHIYLCSIQSIGLFESNFITKRPIHQLTDECSFVPFMPPIEYLSGEIQTTDFADEAWTPLIPYEMESNPFEMTSSITCQIECDDELDFDLNLGECPGELSYVSINGEFENTIWTFPDESSIDATSIEFGSNDSTALSLDVIEGMCLYDTTLVFLSDFPAALTDSSFIILSCDPEVTINETFFHQEFDASYPSLPFSISTSDSVSVMLENECETSVVDVYFPSNGLWFDYSVTQDSECHPAVLSIDASEQHNAYLEHDFSILDSTYILLHDITIIIEDTLTGCSGEFLIDAPYYNPNLCNTCQLEYYVPNAFSPNNDGLNDSFAPSISCDLENYELAIYNRWGEQIFKTSSVNDYWNGSVNSGDYFAPNGIYTWVMKLEEETILGHVNLLR